MTRASQASIRSWVGVSGPPWSSMAAPPAGFQLGERDGHYQVWALPTDHGQVGGVEALAAQFGESVAAAFGQGSLVFGGRCGQRVEGGA